MSDLGLNPPTGSRPARPRAGLVDRLALVTASFFGSGYSPVAPGTAGTLATLPLWWLLARGVGPLGYVAATLALLLVGIAAAHRVSRSLGIEDPGVVVIDETVGFLVTMSFIEPTLPAALLGFLVFRVLDVLKPLGIDRLERLPGGYGIMMDDFAAGVVGNLVVRVALLLAASF